MLRSITVVLLVWVRIMVVDAALSEQMKRALDVVNDTPHIERQNSHGRCAVVPCRQNRPLNPVPLEGCPATHIIHSEHTTPDGACLCRQFGKYANLQVVMYVQSDTKPVKMTSTILIVTPQTTADDVIREADQYRLEFHDDYFQGPPVFEAAFLLNDPNKYPLRNTDRLHKFIDMYNSFFVVIGMFQSVGSISVSLWMPLEGLSPGRIAIVRVPYGEVTTPLQLIHDVFRITGESPREKWGFNSAQPMLILPSKSKISPVKTDYHNRLTAEDLRFYKELRALIGFNNKIDFFPAIDNDTNKMVDPPPCRVNILPSDSIQSILKYCENQLASYAEINFKDIVPADKTEFYSTEELDPNRKLPDIRREGQLYYRRWKYPTAKLLIVGHINRYNFVIAKVIFMPLNRPVQTAPAGRIDLDDRIPDLLEKLFRYDVRANDRLRLTAYATELTELDTPIAPASTDDPSEILRKFLLDNSFVWFSHNRLDRIVIEMIDHEMEQPIYDCYGNLTNHTYRSASGRPSYDSIRPEANERFTPTNPYIRPTSRQGSMVTAPTRPNSAANGLSQLTPRDIQQMVGQRSHSARPPPNGPYDTKFPSKRPPPRK